MNRDLEILQQIRLALISLELYDVHRRAGREHDAASSVAHAKALLCAVALSLDTDLELYEKWVEVRVQ